MTHSNYFSLISAQLDALHSQLSGLCNLTLAAASDTVLTAVQINHLLTPMLQTVDSIYDLVDLEAQETTEPTTPEPAPTDPALQPPTLFDEQLARLFNEQLACMQAETPVKADPCIVREYVSVEDIQNSLNPIKNIYSYTEVATATKALLALNGNPLTPLVVREIAANEYTLIYGELELFAARHAHEINPAFEEVQAFVVRNEVDDKAATDYLAAFVGFEKVEG